MKIVKNTLKLKLNKTLKASIFKSQNKSAFNKYSYTKKINSGSVILPVLVVKKKDVWKSVYKTKLHQVYCMELYKRKCSDDFTIQTKNVWYFNKRNSKIFRTIGVLFIGLIIGFINGFWGGGGGMVCVPTLTGILKLKDKTAHATAILVMLPLSIASLVVYLLKSPMDYSTAGFVAGGFIVGGLVGAILLKKINNIVLQIVFALVIIAGGIKILI